MTNRKVICAGCCQIFPEQSTHFYRNKRCCGLSECVQEIDKKIKHRNYLKQRKKFQKGTHRRGVEPALREYVVTRDNRLCRACMKVIPELQVHHIVPVSNGGTDEKTNLITLCNMCHVRVHQEGYEKYFDFFNTYVTKVYEQENKMKECVV